LYFLILQDVYANEKNFPEENILGFAKLQDFYFMFLSFSSIFFFALIVCLLLIILCLIKKRPKGQEIQLSKFNKIDV